MVEYTEWTAIVHDVYQDRGGDYTGQGVVEAVTRAAARFWNENKQEIIRLGLEAARTLAEELIDEYISAEGRFP